MRYEFKIFSRGNIIMNVEMDKKDKNQVILPNWAIVELASLKNSIKLQEIFQWGGLAISLLVIMLSASPHAMFVVPIYIYGISRGDYMIRRDGLKIAVLEEYFGFSGNESMHFQGGSFVALFDAPVFIAMIFLAKGLSPYPISDLSGISIFYWLSCILGIAMILLSGELAKRHRKGYETSIEVDNLAREK